MSSTTFQNNNTTGGAADDTINNNEQQQQQQGQPSVDTSELTTTTTLSESSATTPLPSSDNNNTTSTSNSTTTVTTNSSGGSSSTKKPTKKQNDNAVHSDAFIAQQLMKRIKEKKGGVKVVNKKTNATASSSVNQPSPSSSSSSQGEDKDYSDTENEPKNEYKKGGYHSVTLGDRIGNDRYIIIHKLGWGYFSTVWLCFDNVEKVFRAIKIQKSSKDFTDAAQDEIKLLNHVMTKYREITSTPSSVGVSVVEQQQSVTDSIENVNYSNLRIVGMFDNFVVRGNNGTHQSMGFEVMGSNLLKLSEQFDFKGIPLDIVKIIMRDVLLGLDFLHNQCKIIHTDIKPENILLEQCNTKIKYIMENYQPPELDKPLEERDVSTLNRKQIKKLKQKLKNDGKLELLQELEEKILILEREGKISEDGCNSTKFDNLPKNEQIDLTNIRVKIADFGNSCFTDLKITNDIQTRQYRAPEVIIGAKYFTAADIWSAACMAYELATGAFLFDPQPGKKYTREDDHLALIMETLGPFPHEFLSRGSRSTKFFSSKGDLLRIKKIRKRSIQQNLSEKYGLTDQAALDFTEFLLPMLEILPEKRATAQQMLKHPFLL